MAHLVHQQGQCCHSTRRPSGPFSTCYQMLRPTRLVPCRPATSHWTLSVQQWQQRCMANSTLAYDAQQQVQPVADQPESDGDSGLHDLLVWLVNNGVQGIGSEDSALALYEDAEGDRGILTDQDISAGQVLVRVPLRLAITDVMEEEEQQRVVGQGSMWQDRLVAKLLQERQKGPASPWYPYLQALPKSVPSAVDTFTPEEAGQVQLPVAVAAIKGHAAKMAASWASCRPDAIGGADLKAYRWAHTIVMSRTFGNASPQGGVGVRMCVPLIDMLNHAGDEAVGGLLSTGDVIAQDNVRWDVVSPSNSSSWEMVLSSTRAIPQGEPLLLSYREGPNEEFLLCYGFVPASNPHDTVQLFGGLTEALEHLWQQDLAQGRSVEELRGVYRAAHDAGLQALQDEVAAAAEGVSDSSSWGQLLEALEPIQVASGSRVSGSLIAALEVLQQGDMAAVGAAVASLAWQQLQALPTSLLWDLAWLVQDGLEQQDEQQVQLYGGLLRHYVQAMAAAYEPELWQQLTSVAASAAVSRTGTDTGSKKKRAVPGPPKPQQQQQQQQLLSPPQQQQQSQQPSSSNKALQVAAMPLQMLTNTVLLQQQPKQQEAHEQATAAGSSSSTQQQQHTTGTSCRPWALRLAVKFRAHKKMLLGDVLIAAPLPLQQLVQQQEQLAAYKAASAAARLSPNRVDADGADAVLPWQQ